MKCCDSAGIHWRIALLEFLCTPGPDGTSPSDLMGRQFCGILPMVDKVTNNIYSNEFSDRKDKEKKKFDTKHSRELKPLLVGSTVSYIKSDLKTWNVGVVISHSPDNRSYHIKTENDQVISCNRIHLHKTNVKFVPQAQNIPRVSKVLREEKIVSQPVPNTNMFTKPKTFTANKCSTVSSDAGSNNNCYKTRSGREVRKPPGIGKSQCS